MGAGVENWLGLVNMGAGVGSWSGYLNLNSDIFSTLLSSVSN